MADLVVNLYQKDFLQDTGVKVRDNEIKIKRVLSPNADAVVEFVNKHFTPGWASEVKAGLYKPHPTCFVAVHNAEVVGFACYDATAKGYFGPTGVNPDYRGKNLGQALLMHTLEAMKQDGYGYAIIGGVNDKVTGFYQRHLDLVKIDQKPDLYNRLLNR